MTKQELKKLRDIIYAIYEDGRMRVARIDVCHIACKSILALFKEAGYVKLAEDQSFPENVWTDEEIGDYIYIDSLVKEGWRKVELS